MSATISTQQMIASLTRRVPGLDATYAMEALNDAFRWINQKGSFVWQYARASVTLAAGTGEFSLPTGFDPGKEAVLYGIASAPTPTEIPKLPWGDLVRRQVYQTGSGGTDSRSYAAWGIYASISGSAVTLLGQVFPGAAVPVGGDADVRMIYHRVSFPNLSSGAAVYFPTPDHFDNLIIDIAESEILRVYRMAGWDLAYKRVQDQLAPMLDGYRSTKHTMLRSSEVIEQAQVKQALRS